MSSSKLEKEDTIDFRQLIEKIWKSKKIVFSFISLGLIMSLIHISSIKDAYRSEIKIVNNLSTNSPLVADIVKSFSIEREFYKVENFNEWKLFSKNNSIQYSEFSLSTSDNPNKYLFLKDEEELTVFFDNEVFDNGLDRGSYRRLNIFSNDMEKINAYQSYLNFLADLINKKITQNIKNKTKRFFEISQKYNQESAIEFLKIENFVQYLEENSLYQIYSPSKASKIPQHKLFKLLIGVILGIILSTIYLMFRDTNKD